MRVMSGDVKELFEGVMLQDSEKELLTLTKLSDDDLYRSMGVIGLETISGLRPGMEYSRNPNMGDTTGRSPFFFRHETIEASPSVYLMLPDDPVEAGRVLFGQLEAHFDRIICETATGSPLYGYKQEAIRLGNQCIAAISARYPSIDRRIIAAFVAMRTKGLFSVCTMW